MKTRTTKELIERSQRMSLEHFFCNVGETEWPDNAWELIMAEETFEAGEKCMCTWGPFEDVSTPDLCEMVQDHATYVLYHLKWAAGRRGAK